MRLGTCSPPSGGHSGSADNYAASPSCSLQSVSFPGDAAGPSNTVRTSPSCSTSLSSLASCRLAAGIARGVAIGCDCAGMRPARFVALRLLSLCSKLVALRPGVSRFPGHSGPGGVLPARTRASPCMTFWHSPALIPDSGVASRLPQQNRPPPWKCSRFNPAAWRSRHAPSLPARCRSEGVFCRCCRRAGSGNGTSRTHPSRRLGLPPSSTRRKDRAALRTSGVALSGRALTPRHALA